MNIAFFFNPLAQHFSVGAIFFAVFRPMQSKKSSHLGNELRIGVAIGIYKKKRRGCPRRFVRADTYRSGRPRGDS